MGYCPITRDSEPINCGILGGSRVAYTNKRYVVGNYYEMKARDMKGHLLNARDIVY